MRRPRWCLLAVVSAVALVAAACKGPAPSGKGGNRRALEFPVEVEPVAARAVEYEVRADGSIDVFERVQITARVAGVVEKIAFREGQHVAAGDLLVTIDADRYELAARQAAAVVARAKAALADAESSLARRRAVEADSPGVVPPEEMEAYQTKVDTARADVTEKQVMLERARLDRRDAYVRAPSAGVIQSRDVVTGSYAQPGTLLATLVQREPLQVRFDVAETDAARIPVGAEVRFTVDGDERDWAAKVTHVAEVADPRSRMVRVSADVTSDGRDALRAGGFAQVVVPVGSRGAAPVIPELSIRPSERGFLVFVVIDGVAHERIVEIGMRTHDGLVEVRSGVAVGDQLVVRGAEALRDGAKVKVVTAAPAPATPPGAGGAAGSAAGPAQGAR